MYYSIQENVSELMLLGRDLYILNYQISIISDEICFNFEWV